MYYNMSGYKSIIFFIFKTGLFTINYYLYKLYLQIQKYKI